MPVISRRTALLLAGAAALARAPHSRAQAPAWGGKVDDIVREEMALRGIPGLLLGITRNAEPVHVAAFGRSDLELDVAAQPGHLYQSGSTGKMFTATAIMQLVQQRRLAPEDPIARHLPGTPAHWGAITVDQLLRHRSGIADYDEREFDINRDWSNAQLIEAFAAWPLEFEPGTRFAYSNSGYVLLGLLVEAVTGTFYGDWLAAQVFGPAGMRTAQVNDIDAVLTGRARGYARDEDGTLRRPVHVSRSLSRTADGSLLYSLEDLLAWERAITHSLVLPAPLQAQIETAAPYPDGTLPIERYGAGWGTRTVRGHRLVSHGGVWQGFSAWIGRYPEDGLAIMMLCNLESGVPGRFAARIAGAIDAQLRPWDPIGDRDPARTARDREQLQRYLAAGAGARAPAQQRRHAAEIGAFEASHRFVLVDDARGRTYRFGEGDGGLLAHFAPDGQIGFDIP